jgi:serine/threonine protein kinase
MIQHVRCDRVKESDVMFDSHLSGFVYKVKVHDQILVKKEIPGPDNVDEFLYEINALHRLRNAKSVVTFHGVVVDDDEEFVKGLLISYADKGALIDIIYDHGLSLPWSRRAKWAKQIVTGLSEIHEEGFVQGDFTLSNIVVDKDDNAKIIDINRRGCPVGWEPPEATPLIESNQRIFMYISVKTDLFQLGMVLWALATAEDEPEAHGRPLRISEQLDVPQWYRRIVEICLSDDPKARLQAVQLISEFPPDDPDSQQPIISVDSNDEPHMAWKASNPGVYAPDVPEDPYFYPSRGRSPASRPPSYDHMISPAASPWQGMSGGPQSLDPNDLDEGPRSLTPRLSRESLPAEERVSAVDLKSPATFNTSESTTHDELPTI